MAQLKTECLRRTQVKTRAHELAVRTGRLAAARRVVTGAGITLLVVLTAWTAIMAKEARGTPALMDVVAVNSGSQGGPEIAGEAPVPAAEITSGMKKLCSDSAVRWFNGRPAKPAKTIEMTVTAYSPDAQSCGDSADGLTATMHSVETNGGHLVAADPTLLAYGSMLSIEGYAGGQIVPVLDCGGAIKGKHIDLLFPTHEQARQWGVKKIKVTVWEYVDGKPAENPRKVR
jgi:3D (Asp-Asp-Asp) domain-containing protein